MANVVLGGLISSFDSQIIPLERQMEPVDRLLTFAGSILCKNEPYLPDDLLLLAGKHADDLIALLRRHNGFYAFANALHVFPAGTTLFGYGLTEWNSLGLWRYTYGDMADGCLFFAENLFGDQYVIREDQFFWFDHETGSLEPVSDTLTGWAKAILDDLDAVGYSVALKLQGEYGDIPAGMRLFPKIPFVTGGIACLDNLFLGRSVNGMNFGGELATQIRNLPDGAKIKIRIVE